VSDGVTVRHSHHVFDNPAPATPVQVRAALHRGDLPEALDAMVGTALYGDGDWKELQDLYLQLLTTTTTKSAPSPQPAWGISQGSTVNSTSVR
jgi:hypothetical protein